MRTFKIILMLVIISISNIILANKTQPAVNGLNAKRTSGEAPSISTYIYNSGLDLPAPTLNVTKNATYSFNSLIQIPGGDLIKGDVYFGVYLPDRNKPFSWQHDGTLISPQRLTPIIRGIDLKEKYGFDITSILGKEIKYTFTGSEPVGMYLIYTLITVSDTDPSDTDNWISIYMSPFFFN